MAAEEDTLFGPGAKVTVVEANASSGISTNTDLNYLPVDTNNLNKVLSPQGIPSVELAAKLPGKFWGIPNPTSWVESLTSSTDVQQIQQDILERRTQSTWLAFRSKKTTEPQDRISLLGQINASLPEDIRVPDGEVVVAGMSCEKFIVNGGNEVLLVPKNGKELGVPSFALSLDKKLIPGARPKGAESEVEFVRPHLFKEEAGEGFSLLHDLSFTSDNQPYQEVRSVTIPASSVDLGNAAYNQCRQVRISHITDPRADANPAYRRQFQIASLQPYGTGEGGLINAYRVISENAEDIGVTRSEGRVYYYRAGHFNAPQEVYKAANPLVFIFGPKLIGKPLVDLTLNGIREVNNFSV